MLMVTFSDVTRPEVFDLGHKTISAYVIRVDRKALLTTGHLAVGIRFNRIPAEAQSATA